jgi:hypothetical protein
MLLLLPLLLVASLGSFVSLAPAPANAAVPTVYVQHEAVRATNPIAATFNDANHSASSSFATGRFEALATTPAAASRSRADRPDPVRRVKAASSWRPIDFV